MEYNIKKELKKLKVGDTVRGMQIDTINGRVVVLPFCDVVVRVTRREITLGVLGRFNYDGLPVKGFARMLGTIEKYQTAQDEEIELLKKKLREQEVLKKKLGEQEVLMREATETTINDLRRTLNTQRERLKVEREIVKDLFISAGFVPAGIDFETLTPLYRRRTLLERMDALYDRIVS